MTLPNYQAAGTAVHGITAQTVAWPAHATGDIGFLLVQIFPADTQTTPTGWTLLLHASPVSHEQYLFWKEAASGSEAAVVLDTPANYQLGQIFTVRGALNGVSPVDQTATQFNTPGTTTFTAPTITPSVNECLILIISSTGLDSISVTLFSAWTNATVDGATVTEQFESATNAGGGGTFALATATMTTAGAIGATTATIATTTTSEAFTISIKPAAGAAPYTLTAAMGAFTMSGQVAGVLAQRRLTAAAGAFTMTGIAANLSPARRLTAAVGSFVLTGFSVVTPAGLGGAFAFFKRRLGIGISLNVQ